MYADDTLLMSKSKKGLDKAHIFCRKWQLAINTGKTNIMTFNKSKYMDGPFYLNGHPLEKVHTYNYLGLKINNNGSFTVAIKELYNKALRAFMAMKSAFIGTQLSPRIYRKRFDALVKPLAVYGCEVWGAFGHKICPPNEIPSSFYMKDTSPYEQLHIRDCKHILAISKHASNMELEQSWGGSLLCSI